MSDLRISLIVPVLNAIDHLPQVLPPLESALASGDLHELWIVDDGSRDASVEFCRQRGVQVLDTEAPDANPQGPAAARNRAARRATGELLMFVDSDVVVTKDLPRRMAAILSQNPDVVAIFGSYDDSPFAPGRLSRCRNLLHHWVHQQASGEATTFWAGLGMVRRADFDAVGGFDAERYPRPSIEDIELGSRLRDRGRILLCAELQCTHRKRWTWSSMISTDLFCRAVPWSLLMRERPAISRSLNLKLSERLRAIGTGLMLLSLCGLLWEPAPSAAVFAVSAAGSVWWDRPFLALCGRRYGALSAVVAFLMLRVYYLTAMLGLCLARLQRVNTNNTPRADSAVS